MATVAVPTQTCKTLIHELYGEGDQAAHVLPTQPEPLPEAAFSLTIHGTIGGHTAMLTIRGGSAAAFAANVQAVRGMLDAPARSAAPAQPTPEKPAVSPDGWCDVHQVAMARQANARGSWLSHKTVDGWCKGK